jgi:hypothetical protein
MEYFDPGLSHPMPRLSDMAPLQAPRLHSALLRLAPTVPVSNAPTATLLLTPPHLRPFVVWLTSHRILIFLRGALQSPIPRAKAPRHIIKLQSTVPSIPVSLIPSMCIKFQSHIRIGPQYYIRAPTAPYGVTPASSRTGSSASLHPGTPGVAYTHSLSRSTSHSINSKPSRPALKQNHTWQSGGTASSTGRESQTTIYLIKRFESINSYIIEASSHARSHVTFHSPSNLHMHPLFAYSRLHHAPIVYDVTHTPSAQTVLDCTTRSPVPAHTLAQPATDPPTSAPSQLVLRSHKFPWTIVVNASGHSDSNSSGRSSRKSSRSHTRSPSVQGSTITNLDVLYAVHTTLLARVTPEEWEALGNGSKAQRKVTKAYEKRCTSTGGWESGVRRVDWLGAKTNLKGIEVDKTGGNSVGKLIFSKA